MAIITTIYKKADLDGGNNKSIITTAKEAVTQPEIDVNSKVFIVDALPNYTITSIVPTVNGYYNSGVVDSVEYSATENKYYITVTGFDAISLENDNIDLSILWNYKKYKDLVLADNTGNLTDDNGQIITN